MVGNLLQQVEARPITRVRGQIETKKGVDITEGDASQAVPLDLRYLASRRKHVDVIPDVTAIVDSVGRAWRAPADSPRRRRGSISHYAWRETVF